MRVRSFVVTAGGSCGGSHHLSGRVQHVTETRPVALRHIGPQYESSLHLAFGRRKKRHTTPCYDPAPPTRKAWSKLAYLEGCSGSSVFFGFSLAGLLGGGVTALLGGGVTALLGGGVTALLGGGVTALLGGGVTALLGGGVTALLGGGVTALLGGGVTALLGGGVTALLGGGVTALLGGGVTALLGGGVTGLLGGGVTALLGGGVAGFTAGGTGLPGAGAAAGLVAGAGGGSFFAGGAGGAGLTRLDLAIVSLCPMGTTCGDGFILVTMGRFASAAGGRADAFTAAAGARFLGGAAAVLSTTWGC